MLYSCTSIFMSVYRRVAFHSVQMGDALKPSQKISVWTKGEEKPATALFFLQSFQNSLERVDTMQKSQLLGGGNQIQERRKRS